MQVNCIASLALLLCFAAPSGPCVKLRRIPRPSPHVQRTEANSLPRNRGPCMPPCGQASVLGRTFCRTPPKPLAPNQAWCRHPQKHANFLSLSPSWGSHPSSLNSSAARPRLSLFSRSLAHLVPSLLSLPSFLAVPHSIVLLRTSLNPGRAKGKRNRCRLRQGDKSSRAQSRLYYHPSSASLSASVPKEQESRLTSFQLQPIYSFSTSHLCPQHTVCRLAHFRLQTSYVYCRPSSSEARIRL